MEIRSAMLGAGSVLISIPLSRVVLTGETWTSASIGMATLGLVFFGVGLFAGGMGILIASSHLHVSRWHLLPGLIVAGFGRFGHIIGRLLRANGIPRHEEAAGGFHTVERASIERLNFLLVAGLQWN